MILLLLVFSTLIWIILYNAEFYRDSNNILHCIIWFSWFGERKFIHWSAK